MRFVSREQELARLNRYLPFRTMLQTLTDTSMAATAANQKRANWQGLVQTSTDILLGWGTRPGGHFCAGCGNLCPARPHYGQIGRAVGQIGQARQQRQGQHCCDDAGGAEPDFVAVHKCHRPIIDARTSPAGAG